MLWLGMGNNETESEQMEIYTTDKTEAAKVKANTVHSGAKTGLS